VTADPFIGARAAARMEMLRRESYRLMQYSPTPQAQCFHLDPWGSKGMFGPNQLGKTATGVVEVLVDIFGLNDRFGWPRWNPHLRVRTWWIVVSSWRGATVSQKAVHEWAPADWIDWDQSIYTDKNGFSGDFVRFTGGPWEGSWIRWKTAGQARKKDQAEELAGETLTGGYLVDEPAALRDANIRTELDGRVLRHGARRLFTFTPQGDLSSIRKICIRVSQNGEPAEPEHDPDNLRRFQSPDAPGVWRVHKYHLTLKCATTVDGKTQLRTQDQIDAYIAGIEERLKPTRVYSEWQGPPEEVAFPEYSPELLVHDHDVSWLWADDADYELSLGMDLGALAGSCVAYLHAIQKYREGRVVRWRVHTLGEWVSETATTPEEDVEHIRDMLRKVVPALYGRRPSEFTDVQLFQAVDRWYIDVAHQGNQRRGITRKDATKLRRELEHLAGWTEQQHMVKVRVVWKPTGRIHADKRLLRGLMKHQMWTISKRLRLLPVALSSWDGTIDDRVAWDEGGGRKHLIDGCRYGATEPILGRRGMERAISSHGVSLNLPL